MSRLKVAKTKANRKSKAKPQPKRKRLHLYWYITPNNLDDWFVVSSSKRSAMSWLESEEGALSMERILTIPADVEFEDGDPGWPQVDFLRKLGATVILEKSPRTVLLNGRVFSEGGLEAMTRQAADDIIEQRGGGRPNRTRPKSES